ncbi:MAG: tyrosine-type recombinase/integrase [Candidatus Magasanikbacteria bacterium]|nr:tyrosine-type recombinase/integrase [Candidatus Magasanikbacteria bacterium]
MSKNLLEFLQEFLEHLEIEKNRSPKTLQNYEFYVNRFIEWFGDKKPEKINLEEVRKYRIWLNRLEDVHGDPLKNNTQNYHLIALRSFLKYLAKRDVKTLTPEKIELMKMPDRDITFLEASDLNRILEAPEKHLKTQQTKNPKVSRTTKLIAYRDKSILEMLFSTGLRVSELAKLKKENVNVKRDEFTVKGKGQKSRIVFLSEQAKHWVKKYIAERNDMNPYLFISHNPNKTGEKIEHAPITPRSIQRLTEKYGKLAGITKQVTPHTLRHSYATDLLRNGADIRSVQIMLGHTSITTTQIYTHISDRELKSVYKKFHNKDKESG